MGWRTTLPANLLALLLCDRILEGFRIEGFWSFGIAVVAMILPLLLWAHLGKFGGERMPETLPRLFDTRPGGFVLAVLMVLWVAVIPTLIVTCLPGLALAEWLSPSFTIDGGWTYVWACVITATALWSLRELQPGPFWRTALKAFGNPDYEDAKRSITEAGFAITGGENPRHFGGSWWITLASPTTRVVWDAMAPAVYIQVPAEMSDGFDGWEDVVTIEDDGRIDEDSIVSELRKYSDAPT